MGGPAGSARRASTARCRCRPPESTPTAQCRGRHGRRGGASRRRQLCAGPHRQDREVEPGVACQLGVGLDRIDHHADDMNTRRRMSSKLSCRPCSSDTQKGHNGRGRRRAGAACGESPTAAPPVPSDRSTRMRGPAHRGRDPAPRHRGRDVEEVRKEACEDDGSRQKPLRHPSVRRTPHRQDREPDAMAIRIQFGTRAAAHRCQPSGEEKDDGKSSPPRPRRRGAGRRAPVPMARAQTSTVLRRSPSRIF